MQGLCTPCNHAPCHFMQSHIRKVYACLAVTCHLHFWQNDRDLLRATAVTRGWNGYRNKSQHRKSTLEKIILPPLLHWFEPAAFQSRIWRSNHWAIPDHQITCWRIAGLSLSGKLFFRVYNFPHILLRRNKAFLDLTRLNLYHASSPGMWDGNVRVSEMSDTEKEKKESFRVTKNKASYQPYPSPVTQRHRQEVL